MTVKEFEITEAVNLNVCERTQKTKEYLEALQCYIDIKESEK